MINKYYLKKKTFDRFEYKWYAALLLLAFFILATLSSANAARDYQGNEYWLAFPENHNDAGRPLTLSLFLTGATDTSGSVDIPSLDFSEAFNVTAGTVSTVVVPNAVELDGEDSIEDKGIHITADDEITVYGLTQRQFTTDAYLGLSTDTLGTEYIVVGYEPLPGFPDSTAQFAVVAIEDATVVTITPSVDIGGHPVDIPFQINLNKGQTYQLRGGDLTGTSVNGDKPIAVLSGHRCAYVPTNHQACDTLVEHVPPISTWGQSFVTMPLATRLNGDTFRILASSDNTTVSINGVDVASLEQGQFHEQIIAEPSFITSNQPILVVQYSNGSTYDGVTSDPFMMLIPPHEQFLGDYTITTPATIFSINYVNVVASTSAVGSINLDGVVIPATDFTPIGTTGFSGAQVPISPGAHSLSGTAAFGVFVYGYADFDSYGYPGGQGLGEVALASNLTLDPETASNPVGQEHCVTATVTDQNEIPLPDVRVDFTATGTHDETGFGITDVNGETPFCYTGTEIGTDIITAMVSDLTATAEAIWTEAMAGIVLTPASGSQCVVDDNMYTVTASVTDDMGNPVPAVDVTFEITDGPNMGLTGMATTDSAGMATFTYTAADLDGVDTIVASYDDGSMTVFSNPATVTWQCNPTDVTLSDFSGNLLAQPSAIFIALIATVVSLSCGALIWHRSQTV